MSRLHISDDEEPDCDVPLLREYYHHGGPRQTSPAPPAQTSWRQSQYQEVKYTFRPCSVEGEDAEDSGSDYAHINIPARPAPLGCSTTPQGKPPPYSRTSHSGLPSAGIHRFPPPFQAISNGRFQVDSDQSQAKGKSWIPAVLSPHSQGYRVGQRNTHSRQESSARNAGWPSPHHAAETRSFPDCQPLGQPQHLSHPQSQLQSQGHGRSADHPRGDEMRECVPPRLAPVSGVLSETSGRKLIRPVAFKPAVSGVGMCQQCGEGSGRCGCGCGGGGGAMTSQSHGQQDGQANSSALSPVGVLSGRSGALRSEERDSGGGSLWPSHAGPDGGDDVDDDDDDSPGVNVDASPTHKSWGTSLEVLVQTPSPSDSGVGELEAMLREREAEISTLRQVMDCNERAIFQVYEERKGQWLREMQEIQAEYERRLKQQQQEASRLEQALASQVQRLQHDKAVLAAHDLTDNSLLTGNDFGDIALMIGQEFGDKAVLKSQEFGDKAVLKSQEFGGKALLKGQDFDDKAVLTDGDTGDQTPLIAGRNPGDQASQSSTAPMFLQRQASTLSTHSDTSLPSRFPAPKKTSSSALSLSGDTTQALSAVQCEMAMKNTEILGLRSQLLSLQARLEAKVQQLQDVRQEAATKTEELASLHDQLHQLSDAGRASVCDTLTQTGGGGGGEEDDTCLQLIPSEEYTLSLERQVDALREQVEVAEARRATEQVLWAEEKNKVIRYQKQLQLNYVQMQRKNTALEAEVEQLTLELESREMKLLAAAEEEEEEESAC